MEDGIIVVDAQMRVVDVNPAAAGLLNRSSAEMVGQPAEQALGNWPALVELLRNVNDQCTEMSLGQGAGRRVISACVFGLGEQQEHLSGRLIILRDVSERRRAERDLEKAVEAAKEAKSEFISVASHEMRAPITCIKGFTDLLAKGTAGPVTDFQAEFLGTIRANADRLTCLVSDLSDIARIEAGRLRLEFGSVALEEVVGDAVEDVQTQLDRKDQALTVDVPHDLPCVHGDHDRLVQVLVNLLSNAHRFTPPGGQITVVVELQYDQDEGERIQVVVRDNGIGIAPEEQMRVFEKFYRSEDRKVSEVPGSGLGLSIAKSLVEMQGGRIWLESAFRGGTTVGFSLPVGGKR
jgi:signal transduction histidine kinase